MPGLIRAVSSSLSPNYSEPRDAKSDTESTENMSLDGYRPVSAPTAVGSRLEKLALLCTCGQSRTCLCCLIVLKGVVLGNGENLVVGAWPCSSSHPPRNADLFVVQSSSRASKNSWAFRFQFIQPDTSCPLQRGPPFRFRHCKFLLLLFSGLSSKGKFLGSLSGR